MLSSFGSLDSKDLEVFQRNNNLDLPDDYKEYLLRNNGGSANDEIVCFNAEKIAEPIALGSLFGVGNAKESLSIETWLNEYRDELLENMLIIGHATGSGLVLLVNQEDWKGIYFWDNCLDYENSTEDECMYFVAKTFIEFLNGLFLYKE
ncbi:SMI1/KNR4 family protein [Lacrimispora indolis]|uniref:SMI1/KNR4 family protein n=1 Tax=Lacrimispora indolis TaxID=69825 RepID=UPI00045EA8A2|nr:SMI1/KNR4 family protein [Lacrimispora indolis]